MKTTATTFGVFLIFLFSVVYVFGQEPKITPEPLETIYLNQSNSSSTINDFDAILLEFLNNEQIRYKDILKREGTPIILSYNAEIKFQTTTKRYLRVLRRGINKSNSYEEFLGYVTSKYPKMESYLTHNSILKQLYTYKRPATFNGYVASLPSFI